MRAVELCKLIRSEQSLNLAVKYAIRIGNVSLADKITEIIENEVNAGNELIEMTPYSKMFNNSSSSHK